MNYQSDKPLLIKGGTVVIPSAGLEDKRDVLVVDGQVAGIDRPGSFDSVDGAQTYDISGKILTSGLVDLHVHLREPGQEWKENIETGARAAVAGGFTDVCCMPNTKPTNDNGQITSFILQRARDAGLCRVHPIGAITHAQKGQELAPLVELHEAGCVAFSDDGYPVASSLMMRRALEYSSMFGGILAVHEEDKILAGDWSMNESALSLEMGLRGMPGAAEDIMIGRDIELARITGGRVHFCHVSTRRAVTLIRRAKEDGIQVSAEVLPHNFTLTESAVRDFNTAAKMSMPLRSDDDVDGVLEGLAQGVIDCISSDHAPHEADSKNVEFDKASFGIIGLQTTIPLTLEKVRQGKLSLMRAISALTDDPRRCFGLPMTGLRVGASADLTVIDPLQPFVLNKQSNKSRSSNSPFWGCQLTGAAESTIIAGNFVYRASSDSFNPSCRTS